MTTASRRWRIETIFSPRNAKIERLIPTNKTKNAPVKFLRERGFTLFFLLTIGGFPSHWGGMGRIQASQKSTKPIWCNSNILNITQTFYFRNSQSMMRPIVRLDLICLPLTYSFGVGTVFSQSKRVRGADENLFSYLKIALTSLLKIFSNFVFEINSCL